MKSVYVRNYLRKNRIRLYELASELDVSEATLIRWLRATELTATQSERIEQAMKLLVEKISEVRNEQM